MRLDTAARRVRREIDALDAALTEALDSGVPTARLAATLALLDRSGKSHEPGAGQSLAAVRDRLRTALGERLPFGEPQAFDGVGVLERSMSGRRYAWEDGRLLAHQIATRAAERVCYDPETGARREPPPPPAVIAQAVADELIATGGLDNASASWRSGALEERNITLDRYRRVANEGQQSVRWKD